MGKKNSGWGKLPLLITNEISKFLDVKDIQSFGAANRHLYQNIKNNPFIQERIVDAKLTIEKIYDIVHEIALSEYGKSFWRNGDGRYGIPDKIWKYSVGRHLKILGGDRDKTPMVTFLEQLMFAVDVFRSFEHG